MKVAERFEGAYGSMYYVADMAKAVSYYKDAFGLEPKVESPEWSEFDLNGHTLCLHATTETAKLTGRGVLIAKVKGLEEVVATLKTKGVEFDGDIHEVCEGGYSADFRDPAGNHISLFEYKG